jgi:hypothetical protein
VFPRNSSTLCKLSWSQRDLYQCGEYCLFVGRMVVEIGAEVEVDVSGFAVNLTAQGTIRFMVDVNISEGKLIPFYTALQPRKQPSSRVQFANSYSVFFFVLLLQYVFRPNQYFRIFRNI